MNINKEDNVFWFNIATDDKRRLTILHIHGKDNPTEIQETVEQHPGGRYLPVGILNINAKRVLLDHDDKTEVNLPDATYYCRVSLN